MDQAETVVSHAHRFLFGETPASAERRVWLLHGQTQDFFFHDILHGCLDLRRTLELWGLESGMDLTVTIDRFGRLDFSGNADPVAAEALFEGGRPRRAPRYANRRAGHAPAPESAPAPAPEPAAPTPAETERAERAAQAAQQARQAAGGAGQALENSLGKISQILRNRELSTLVLVEDFPFLIRSLSFDQQTAPLVDRLLAMAQSDWHGRISHSNLVVFLAHTPQGLDFLQREVFPAETFRGVTVKNLKGPEVAEIGAALERVSARHGFTIAAPEPVAKVLARLGNLSIALGTVRRGLQAPLSRGSGAGGSRREVTLNDVLQLPAINLGQVAEIRREVGRLVGLGDVKARLENLGVRAQMFRQRLADGASDLPEDTFHLVFTGNPGTGKTTVARLVARYFHALGFLRRDTVKELTASVVMSSNIGETRERMQREIEDAVGGVLFIDEAHQLGVAESTQAREAVEALVPAAWNHRHQLVIILAGYDDRMHDFFKMDPGLDRRFPTHNRVRFPDYTQDELWTILARRLEQRGYTIQAAAAGSLRAVLTHRARRRAFGNAGGVENLVAELLFRHTTGPDAATSVLTSADVPSLIRRDDAVLQEATTRLDTLVGLEPVRERIGRLMQKIRYDLEEAEDGQAGAGHQHPGNMLFLGPPGTGKTTIARLMGDLLFGLGCLERRSHVSVSRESLIGRYQGHSTANLMAALDQARDGVFFLDEAYGLALDEGDTYGNELVTALVGQITNPENAGTVFILAGYDAEMQQFLQRNAGLQRRFPVVIDFPRFTPGACAELARRTLTAQGFTWGPGVPERVAQLAAEASERLGARFGNAGWVESLMDSAAGEMRSRVLNAEIPRGHAGRRQVILDDLPAPAAGAPPVGGAPASLSPWTTREIALPSPRPTLAAETRETLGALIAASACQLVVTTAEGGTAGGTGFFVSADGLLATSAHVVEGTTNVRAFCGSGRTPVPARVVALNHDLDLALLAVDQAHAAPPLPLGESFEVPALSEVIVFGNAHVTPGEAGRLVLARVARNERGNPRHIETDGAIEPGFSGGPAVHAATGGVVGVVMGGYGPSATLLVRAEQLRIMLEDLGYRQG